jgi:hypothetical protein
MGLENFIVKQVVKIAKDTAKVQDSIATMQNKLANENLKLIDISGINVQLLSFDIIALAKGEIEAPEDILTPEVICSTPPLTTSQKEITQKEVNNLKLKTSAIIDNINSLQEALITIQQPLTTLSVTSNNVKKAIKTVSTTIKVIKAIPAPVAIFGVGIPINVLTILSDALVQLDKLITAGKGITKLVPIIIDAVLGMISQTIKSLNEAILKIEPTLTILSFIQAKITLGDKCPTVTQGEINAVQLNLTADLQSSIADLGDSSIAAVNVFNDDELTTALQPNALEPFIYQGFTLILEFDPTNTFSYPRRRIRADRSFSSETSTFFTFSSSSPKIPLNGSIILYNDPGNLGRYSFASSTQILVQEMKYKIDQYLFGVVEQVNVEEAIDNVGRDDSSGDDSSGDNSSGGGPLAGLGGTPAFVPYTISYNSSEYVNNELNTGTSGNITIPIPPPGQNSEDIKISMNQFGLTSTDDVNESSLMINKGIGNLIGARHNSKSLQFDSFYGDNNSPIVIFSPGIYSFTLTMNSTAIGTQIKTELLIETQ